MFKNVNCFCFFQFSQIFLYYQIDLSIEQKKKSGVFNIAKFLYKKIFICKIYGIPNPS